jgi:hypothetical protein
LKDNICTNDSLPTTCASRILQSTHIPIHSPAFPRSLPIPRQSIAFPCPICPDFEFPS